jgi:hypothetical protein
MRAERVVVKVFSHITEFGPAGMQNIPALTFLSEKVSLWSPSASFIEEANRTGHSDLTPRDMLELVDGGHIQIMGRHRWFFDKNLRNNYPSGYRFANWDNSFDNTLQLMAVQDRDEALENRRVLIADEEDGRSWAEEAIESSADAHVAAVATAKAILSSGHTLGLDEKLAKAKTETDRVKIVLRDIRNHSKAFSDSRADQVVVMAQEAQSYAQAVSGDNRNRLGFAAEQEKLPELVDFLSKISKPRDLRELLRLLNDKDIAIFRDEVTALMQSSAPVDVEVLARIQAGTPELTWSDTLWGRDLIQATTRLGPTALGLLIAFLTIQFEPAALIGLLIQGIQTAVPLGTKLGALPAPDYVGPRFPFILGFGRGSPTYTQIREMVALIEEARG